MLLGVTDIRKTITLSNLLYKIILIDHLTNGFNYNWINTVKNKRDNLGMGDVWITHLSYQ